MAGRDPRTTYLWLPDDDITASSCDVSRFLALMQEQQLLLAQVGEGRGGGGALAEPGASEALQFIKVRKLLLLRCHSVSGQLSALCFPHPISPRSQDVDLPRRQHQHLVGTSVSAAGHRPALHNLVSST